MSRRLNWVLIPLCLLSAGVARAQNKETSEELQEWFEREVRPVFAEHCSGCHDVGISVTKGGLSLHSREALLAGGDSGPAIVPGEPDESLLIEAIRRESYEMPPEAPLPKRALEILEKWVALGAPWPDSPQVEEAVGDWRSKRFQSHWAWQPVKSVSVPQVADDHWSRNEIDKFVLSKLREEGLEPAREADIRTLLRRLNFDLLGLPPERDSLQQPWAEREVHQEIERLLASPQFGVRWGRHWLDLMRYAETLGHEFDYPLHHAWRYRDAVIDSLNEDVPYDRFVLEHLAGDQLHPARYHPATGINQSLALTGFWWLGDSVHAPVDAIGDWATRVDNQIDVVSKAFMGMTVACARCHDHKFDAIGVDDYYGLAGIAQSTRRVYAVTDPHERVANASREIERLLENSEQDATEAFDQCKQDDAVLREWLEALGEKLAELKPEDLDKHFAKDSPALYLQGLTWDESSVDDDTGDLEAPEGGSKGKPASPSFAEQADALAQNVTAGTRRFRQWESSSELYAKFGRSIPKGWTLEGQASPSLRYDWFSQSIPAPIADVFSSRGLGTAQHVILQSPSFDLAYPVISIKARAKSMQSVVSMNNFFMNEFHGLLFGDTRKPVNQTQWSRWYSHAGDLNKYLGAPTFLSFEDRGDAWFEIEEVRFAKTQAPLEPHAVSVQISSLSLESRDALLNVIVNMLRADLPASRDLWRECLRLTGELRVAVPEPLRPLRSIVAEAKYQATRLPTPVSILAATENTPRNAAVAVRGDPHVPGQEVPRTCFVSLTDGAMPDESSSGRLELARKLVDPEHPLTGRVIVNRVWHHLMGRGFVSSTDNFGVLGNRPTHPELLDYLTQEFVAHGWSIKWLVRKITNSQVYRLSSQVTAEQLELDPDARLWSYRPVRRLSAEAVRDSMLKVAASLDVQLGGRSVPVHLSAEMTGRGRPRDSGPLDGRNRRSAYIEIRRNFLDPFLLAFDFPMPSTSAGKRTNSNVPAQALGMLNDPLVSEMVERWVASTSQFEDPRARVQAMIETAFYREPSPTEVEECFAFVEQTGPRGWQELAHVLFNSKEFMYLK